jgi:hypothetical protein
MSDPMERALQVILEFRADGDGVHCDTNKRYPVEWITDATGPVVLRHCDKLPEEVLKRALRMCGGGTGRGCNANFSAPKLTSGKKLNANRSSPADRAPRGTCSALA